MIDIDCCFQLIGQNIFKNKMIGKYKTFFYLILLENKNKTLISYEHIFIHYNCSFLHFYILIFFS